MPLQALGEVVTQTPLCDKNKTKWKQKQKTQRFQSSEVFHGLRIFMLWSNHRGCLFLSSQDYPSDIGDM